MTQLVYALVEFDTEERMEILDIFRKKEDAQTEMKRVWKEGLWVEDNNRTFLMIKEIPLK
jgi:hypothetical protein